MGLLVSPKPRFEHLNLYEDNVKIMDRDLESGGRIVTVYFRPEKVWCDCDNKETCVHIDYAWEIPGVKEKLNSRGIRRLSGPVGNGLPIPESMVRP